MNGPAPAAVVFDCDALLALGAGHRMLSGLVVAAHREAGRHVYVPAICLAAATAVRHGLGEHIGAIPALDVVDLGFAAAIAVGRLVAEGVDWQVAHAIEVARPDVEWPAGRPVITNSTKLYAPYGVATIQP